MAYNIQSEQHQIERRDANSRPEAHRSTLSTSEKLSAEDYRELTGFHHNDELYTDHSPKKKFRKHTRSYERRFTIDPNQTFITIRRKHNQYSVEVSGAIHPDDNEELIENASMLPVGLTLTIIEAFKKIDAE